jgi:hypothetical protein
MTNKIHIKIAPNMTATVEFNDKSGVKHGVANALHPNTIKKIIKEVNKKLYQCKVTP